MFDKLASEERRYEELLHLLGTPAVQSDAAEYRKLAKAQAEIETLVERFRDRKVAIPFPQSEVRLLKSA